MRIVELGGGRGSLEEEAAKSMRRLDLYIGHLWQISEALRTWEQQEKFYQAYRSYLNGGPWAAIALSPDAPSIHQLGQAIDTDERLVEVLNDHGWYQTVYRNGELVEPWHFEYFASRDNHRDQVVELEQGVDGVWRFASPKAIEPTKEIDMHIISTAAGAQKFADEFGADDIGEFFFTPNGPDQSPSWTDNIKAAWLLAGQPVQAADQWQYELARSIADARWNRKRAQIVADTVAALTPVLQLLTPDIDNSVVQKAIDAAVANLHVQATISEADKQAIAALTAKLTNDTAAARLAN